MIWTHGPVLVFLNKNEADLELDRLNREYPSGFEHRKIRPLVFGDTTPPPVTESHKRKSLTDEECDEAIRRSGLWTLACTVPQNLALLRGLCREAAHGIKE